MVGISKISISKDIYKEQWKQVLNYKYYSRDKQYPEAEHSRLLSSKIFIIRKLPFLLLFIYFPDLLS